MHLPASIVALLVLNLALQLFDGVATYVGWEQFGETNPFLRAGFEMWGPGRTLVAAKVVCSLILLWIAWVPRRGLARFALAFVFGAYMVFSCIPWSLRLLS